MPSQVQKRELSLSTAFTTLAYLQILSQSVQNFPMIYQRLIVAAVSLRRIEDFLLAEEQPSPGPVQPQTLSRPALCNAHS